MNLYQETDCYLVEKFTTFDEWLESRGKGIGGSDAAPLCGCSHFKTLQELWFEKIKGQKKEVGGPAVEYGRTCEPALRTLYQAKHLDQNVQYEENICLISKESPWMRYSPDGLIWDRSSERKGILEIKTAFIRNGKQYQEWKEGVPIEYYLQILHGLLVTGFDFVTLTAELRFWDGRAEIIERSYSRRDVMSDLEELKRQETGAWSRYFVGGQIPPVKIRI